MAYNYKIKKITRRVFGMNPKHKYEIYFKKKGGKRWYRSGKTYEKIATAKKDL